MINGELEQFLDSGWYFEATLYYKGFVYWHAGYINSDTKIYSHFVDRWRASLVKEDYNLCIIYDIDGYLVDYERIFEISGNDFDLIKRQFLQAPIYDGKSFWEVEKDLVWVEDLISTTIADRSEMSRE